MVDGEDTGPDGEYHGAVAVRDHVVDHVSRLVWDLRRAGVHISSNAGIEAAQALAAVGFDDRQQVRAALRSALVTRREDRGQFDKVFAHFWERLTNGPDAADGTWNQHQTSAESSERQAQTGAECDEEDGTAGVHGHSSPRSGSELSSHRNGGTSRSNKRSDEGAFDPAPDFGTPGGAGGSDGVLAGGSSTRSRPRYDADDSGDHGDQYKASVYSRSGRPERIDVSTVRAADGLTETVRDLTRAIAERKGRGWNWTPTGNQIDPRRALRQSFGTGGTVVTIPRRARRPTVVRCVLLVDVSQSVLDIIDRGFLVQFLRAVADEARSTRIFFFNTEVRDVTDQFTVPSDAAAVRALQHAEATWGGGTRIGHAIQSIRRQHPHLIDRTTTVFVISDGLETGEVDDLEAGMVWLARHANGLLWLNPLATSAEYEPSCRGMVVALPYVDGIFAFAGPDDIAEIARQLRLRGPGGRIGYEYDSRRTAN